jgi:hypothetical protein
MPAGPELAAALAHIDPAALSGHDLVALAPVYVKLISHYQAGLAAVLDQAAHSAPGDADSPVERREQPSRWAPIEVAATLRWSVRKATTELRYANQLVHRLPIVHAALAGGTIDQARARAFVDGLACMDQQPAQVGRGAAAGRWRRPLGPPDAGRQAAATGHRRGSAGGDPPLCPAAVRAARACPHASGGHRRPTWAQPATGPSRRDHRADHRDRQDRQTTRPAGCHTPASACQLDHTIAKVDGGGHERANGGPLCTREHLFKHQSGAILRQPQPGLFEWITPLGHTYTVRPEPYDEGTGPPDP